MRRTAHYLSVIVTSGVLAALCASPASAATMEATYDMNEPSGATVMVDSSGNGLNGTINQAGLDTGVTFNGATGYEWAFRSPTAPPASPERVIQVPDNPNLDPRNDTWTVELRYRTKYKFGNITQKGQSATKGGQFKIQNPGGMPSCLFKGPSGQVATRSKVALNDNAWHTLKCVKTPTRVTMYVDGAFMSLKNGSTGVIDNKIPLTIGGKINCDQVKVTCDYFSGMIDYLTFTRG
ncbi:LamG-like jellyroll fold domain-containing protein [Nocardioides sp.]|uniref:LamG-like jellyroll fold domain-containing protein n=1 Tax=Nocardioides sp. TaxID=35761 RepID=UPI003D0FFDC2